MVIFGQVSDEGMKEEKKEEIKEEQTEGEEKYDQVWRGLAKNAHVYSDLFSLTKTVKWTCSLKHEESGLLLFW